MDDAAQVIAGIPDFPAIASFYVLFDRRDSPIRIDIPCWDQKLIDVGWHKPVICGFGWCLEGFSYWLLRVGLSQFVVEEC